MRFTAAAPALSRGPLGRLSTFAVACALALSVAACGSTATLAPAPSQGADASAAASAGAPTDATASTKPSPKPAKTPAPGKTATPAPADTATPEPTSPGDTPSPSDSAAPTDSATPAPSASPSAPGPAAQCTGSADNQAFFAQLASKVAWDVYCPVLPAGWHVLSGSSRFAKGGMVDITYSNKSAAAQLHILEGACALWSGGCPPGTGTPGSAAIGGRPARLTDLGGAHFAVIVQEGTTAWEVDETGLDSGTLASFTQAFVAVGH